MSSENTVQNGRSSAGRFTAGNSGKPRGAKHKLQEAFWKDFAEAWQKHGKEAIKTVALTDPGKFIQVAASVMPKELELTDRTFVIVVPADVESVEEWLLQSGQNQLNLQ